MAHGTLHGAEVDASFEQMGGIGVPERLDIRLHLIDKH